LDEIHGFPKIPEQMIEAAKTDGSTALIEFHKKRSRSIIDYRDQRGEKYLKHRMCCFTIFLIWGQIS
jgi:hypothetical protein